MDYTNYIVNHKTTPKFNKLYDKFAVLKIKIGLKKNILHTALKNIRNVMTVDWDEIDDVIKYGKNIVNNKLDIYDREKMDLESEYMDSESEYMDSESEYMDSEIEYMDSESENMDSESENMDLKKVKLKAYKEALNTTGEKAEWIETAIEVHSYSDTDQLYVDYIKNYLYELLRLSIKLAIVEKEMEWELEDMRVAEELDEMETMKVPILSNMSKGGKSYSYSQSHSRSCGGKKKTKKIKTLKKTLKKKSYKKNKKYKYNKRKQTIKKN